ncbi:GatB/YqeY domain-containing protein [Wolinella succinogenes]|uniref:GatB/YqeY domain-containing protein n=1 Tax=Wolinella succinogenes TaxID=844 RepID=UPI002409B2DE|nr:GatB/YqeY domain-containing protein [Wolinella succinogenes]
MSQLKERIAQELKEAMKNRDNFKRDTLRMINSAFKQIEVDERRELSDEDVITILKKACKQREEASIQYKEAGREELYAKEQEEIRIIASYLPEQLSDERLKEELKLILKEVGASSPKDMGKVMGVANSKLSALADGKRISAMVKELLSQP